MSIDFFADKSRLVFLCAVIWHWYSKQDYLKGKIKQFSLNKVLSTLGFIEFLKIYNKDVAVLFECFDKSFYMRKDEMASFYGIKVVDISRTKMDIKNQIESQLQILN